MYFLILIIFFPANLHWLGPQSILSHSVSQRTRFQYFAILNDVYFTLVDKKEIPLL
jgi:hypothetical protein